MNDDNDIHITRSGQGFSISRDDLRRALDSGAGSIRFTAPDGFRFGPDRRLHPDAGPEHEAEIRTALAMWENAATNAHGGNAQKTPLLTTAQLIEAGDQLARIVHAILDSAPAGFPPDGTCRGCGVFMPAGLHPFPWCDLMTGHDD
jgi:hypothetical protein